MASGGVLDLNVIRKAKLQREPYEYLVSDHFVRADAIADVQKSFPDLRTAGFHPVDDMTLTGAFRDMIAEMKGAELAAALSSAFGMDFSKFPRFITVRKVSAAHEGRIHCDSESKVMSLLLYLNDGWSSPDGRLRVLRRQDSFEDYTTEIDPKTGTIFAFLRSDHSWHGHKPFVGERRVVQIAWLRSQEDAARKTKRHRLSGFLKNLLSKPERVN
jgi:SM-20-related protein